MMKRQGFCSALKDHARRKKKMKRRCLNQNACEQFFTLPMKRSSPNFYYGPRPCNSIEDVTPPP